MRLGLQIFETLGGTMLVDWSYKAENVIPTTNEHGFESLSFFVPMDINEAFLFYDQLRNKPVKLVYGGLTVFAGRTEDRKIVDGGLEVVAFGFWRVFSEVPYTALWSDEQTRQWVTATEDNSANYTPARYQLDNNNRLQMAPIKDNTYSQTTLGSWTYETPSESLRTITTIDFDWSLDAPTDWQGRVLTMARDFSAPAVQLTITSVGAPLTGSESITFGGVDRLAFDMRYNNASLTNYPGETGDAFFKVTNIRVATTTTNRVSTTLGTIVGAPGSATVTPASMANIYLGQRLRVGQATTPESVVTTAVTPTTFTATFAQTHIAADTVEAAVVYADEIVKHIIATVNTLNPTQLSADDSQVQSPGVDLHNEIIQDVQPHQTLTRLANEGDNSDPAQIYEAGIYEDQILFFRPKGNDSKLWLVDAAAITLESTMDTLVNVAYGLYSDANGFTRRTTNKTETDSQTINNLGRGDWVQVDTTSNTQAETFRDTFLDDRKVLNARTDIDIIGLMTNDGAPAKGFEARAGDTVAIRNLPTPISQSAGERISTFLLKRSEFDTPNNTPKLTPGEETPELEFLINRIQ